MSDVSALAESALFAGCELDAIDAFARLLDRRELSEGDVLMREGDLDDWFAIVVEGTFSVHHTTTKGVSVVVGSAGPGSIVGEIGMLRGSRRSATVIAQSDVLAFTGKLDAFEFLFDIDGVSERVLKTAAQRLAVQSEAITTTVKDGIEVGIRPLRHADRDTLAAGIADMSHIARKRRFFSGGSVPPRVVDYLANIDYFNHFAWVATVGTEERGIAVCRFIRHAEAQTTAEMAIAIADDHQGIGLGTVLFGALGAAASIAGVEQFDASVLRDNAPMRGLLDRVGAHWETEEPGVVKTNVEVAEVRRLIPDDLAKQLARLAAETMSAAAVPLAESFRTTPRS